MRTLHFTFRPWVNYLPLAVAVAVFAACAGATSRSMRPITSDRSAITVVNGHPRAVRVSLIVAGGKAYYLGTVDAISRKAIRIPPAFSDATVHLLLNAQSRSYRSIPEGAVRVTSIQRPVGAASEYTIEEVHLAAGRYIELRIGQTLNQSRVVVIN